MKKKPKDRHRQPTAYDRDQHELICKALKVSADPGAPGNTAYEAVCELMLKADMALDAKTLPAAKKALRIKPGSLNCIPLYGTETTFIRHPFD